MTQLLLASRPTLTQCSRFMQLWELLRLPRLSFLLLLSGLSQRNALGFNLYVQTRMFLLKLWEASLSFGYLAASLNAAL